MEIDCTHHETLTYPNSETIRTTIQEYKLRKLCQICGDGFEVERIDSPWVICPECRKRLKKLLYDREV